MTPVRRLSTPGQLAALVPHLVGFVPQESLVALSLRRPRSRLGLTLRADLSEEPGLADQVVAALAKDRAGSCALLVHTDEASADRHPWTGLVDRVEGRLGSAGIDVPHALLVRDGRWWSYRCRRACCPSEGTTLETGSAVVQETAAERALEGRAVLASRAELVASLEARPALGPALVRRLQMQAAEALAVRAGRDRAATEREELTRWRAALDAWEQQPAQVPPADSAALVAALHLVPVRDRVASWGLTRAEPLLGLLVQLCRGTVPPDDAPLSAVLGWVAYSRGDGALALVAVQRALRTDPGYVLAGLLLQALDGQLPPAALRAVLRRAA